MIEQNDIEHLKDIFVTRQECDTITGDIKDKLNNDGKDLAVIRTKLDTIVWVSKTTLGAVLAAIVAAVMALIFK